MKLCRSFSIEEILGINPEWEKRGLHFSSSKLISRLDSPRYITEESITFYNKDLPPIKSHEPALAFVEKEQEGQYCQIVVDSTYQAMFDLLINLESQFEKKTVNRSVSTQVHPTSTVEGELKDGVSVGPNCYVGKNTVIAENTKLDSNVSIMDNVRIGKNCVIQSGAVIGSAGFGFFPSKNNVVSIPHFAGVQIGDKVHIGANTVIAAGVLNPTRIGNETKLDSLIQVAHHVEIGSNCFLASQVGIAGSTLIGNRVKIGGSAGIAGHISIGDDVVIAAKSGVTKNWTGPVTIGGFPAQKLSDWKKQVIKNRQYFS